MDDEGESDAWYPTTTETMVYRSFIHKLGLLSSDQVAAVIKAYTLIEEMPKRIGLLSSERNSSCDKPGYIYVEVPHTKTVAGIYKRFLPSINDAIDKLKRVNI